MEREKIRNEFDELMKQIAYLKDLLQDEGKRFGIIRKELLEIKDKFGDARKTEITYLDDEMQIKDLIKEEDVVITISHHGYINVLRLRNTVSNAGVAGEPVVAEPGMKII